MLTKLNRKHAGFTLVEIMIVVAIIALLAAIAVPGFLRARKRSQASKILNDLRMIDAAVDQYAIETNRTTNFVVPVTDWTNYVKKDSILYNTGANLFGDVLRFSDGRYHPYSASRRLRRIVGRCQHGLLVALRPLTGYRSCKISGVLSCKPGGRSFV